MLIPTNDLEPAMHSKIPVLNAAGVVVGATTAAAHKKAAALAGAQSMQQEFRLANGVRQLCWIPAVKR